MSDTESTALVPQGDESPFPILSPSKYMQAKSVLDANLGGGEDIGFSDLSRLKIPGAGGQFFELQSAVGVVSAPTVNVVLLYVGTRRIYWSKVYEGGAERPDCSSFDGREGHGTPGGDCAECPMNQWGSDPRGGDGKACKETRLMFFLREGETLPSVLVAPPSSLKNLRKYLMRLSSEMIHLSGVVTKIGLHKVAGSGKPDYSELTFEAVSKLTDEQFDRVRAYATIIDPILERERSSGVIAATAD